MVVVGVRQAGGVARAAERVAFLHMTKHWACRAAGPNASPGMHAAGLRAQRPQVTIDSL